MSEQMDNNLVLEVREQLVQWLAQEPCAMQRLIDWLQGYHLPSPRHEIEPYEWLLRGLPVADQRKAAKDKLAERVARLLDEEPDVQPLGKRPEQLLHNLLQLCAGLQHRKLLGAPLDRMRKRRRLTGKWLGQDLRRDLTAAVVNNQPNADLRNVWEQLLRGEEIAEGFLKGDAYTIYEGILRMPASEHTWGEPFMDAIGTALAEMATLLENDTTLTEAERLEKFGRLIQRAKDVYGPRPAWDAEFAEQARRKQWPDWAVEVLPPLQKWAVALSRGQSPDLKGVTPANLKEELSSITNSAKASAAARADGVTVLLGLEETCKIACPAQVSKVQEMRGLLYSDMSVITYQGDHDILVREQLRQQYGLQV